MLLDDFNFVVVYKRDDGHFIKRGYDSLSYTLEQVNFMLQFSSTNFISAMVYDCSRYNLWCRYDEIKLLYVYTKLSTGEITKRIAGKYDDHREILK